MASVFVLLEAFNRKEAAALGFFPCATASSLLSECYKKDTFIHSRNKMSSFESLTGNHTNWQRQGCQIIYRFPPSTITELL